MIGIYFSGTGNSRYCMETFLHAYDEEAKCIAIEDERCCSFIEQHEDIVFAYPIYYSTLPKIVHVFIDRNHILFRDKRIFIICTMGLFSGDGAGCAARLFKTYGASIVGGLHVQMPDCIGDEKALKKTLEANQEIVRKAKKKLINAANSLKQNTPSTDGLHVLDQGIGLFGQRLWFGWKTNNYSDKMKVDSNKCIGCGICSRLCPLDNIAIVNKKASSKNSCTLCYRCFAHCPKQAITILGKHVYEQSYIEKYIPKEDVESGTLQAK